MKSRKGGRVRSILGILAMTWAAWASGPDLERARKLYHLTEFQQSLEVLQAIPSKDAAVYALMGRDYYGEGEFRKATEALEKAVALEPGNSEFNLWLGRAYGRRAETSSMITAPGLASKAHQFFEKAARLNPSNLDAQSDLFEYYLEAPGFLGGGFDKASATAVQIAKINPAEGHWAQAKLAEKHKEYSSAEAQLRRAFEIAPQQIGRLIDLARLFSKQGRHQDADVTLAAAAQIAPDSPKLMFARAQIYIQSKRNLDVARQLLKQYLSTSLTPEDPPRADAEKLLKQVQGS